MRVLIFGLGLHGGGYAAATYFLDHGEEVRVTDLKGGSQLKEEVDSLTEKGAVCITGLHREEDFSWADIVVKNPSIPSNHPLLATSKKVINDLSYLFSSPWCSQVKIIAITGTKGKTTTSYAICHALCQMGHEAVLCGNMGISAFTVLSDWEKRESNGQKLPEYLICELSSWQIRDTFIAMEESFIPLEVCALTNFYPDHQNNYVSMEQYLEDKLKLFGPHTKMAIVPDIMHAKIKKLTGLDNKHIKSIDKLTSKFVIENPQEKTAYAILIALGFKHKTVTTALSSFTGVPHRMETVASIKNILCINDSAATIPEAMHFSCSRFSAAVLHIICGGTDKNLQANAMLDTLKLAGSITLLDGNFTQNKLIPLLTQNKIRYFGPYKTMKNATKKAYEQAKTQSDKIPQVIILSPGAASFDLFDNEFDRGDQFRTCIRQLVDDDNAKSQQ